MFSSQTFRLIIVGVADQGGFRNSLTSKGKGHIEIGRYGSSDDVRADSEPVRGQVGVADPSLQIFGLPYSLGEIICNPCDADH